VILRQCIAIDRADHFSGYPVRLPLISVIGLSNSQFRLVLFLFFLALGTHSLDLETLSFPRNWSGTALLHNVRQFMREQFFAFGASGGVCPIAEENVLPGGECNRAHGAIEFMSLGPGMNPHAAEIGAKRRLHLPAYSMIQPLPAAPRPFDRRLDFRRDSCFALSLSG
jgi:hypothetical protein